MNAGRPSQRRAGVAAPALTAGGPLLLAAALAGLSALIGWHGKDLSAQTYRVDELRAHGLILWDVGWYGGNYPLSYSVLTPLVGAGIGLVASGVVFAAGAAWAFDRMVTGRWGRRPAGSWYFAVSTVLLVAIGQLPYLSGEAFALAALWALFPAPGGSGPRRGRRASGGVLLVACALCSGVAAAFAVLALLAWAWHDRRQRWWLIGLAALPIVVVGVLALAFPGTGSFPYSTGGALWSLALCAVALASPLRRLPVIRMGALLYAVLVIGAWAIPSPMGGNASRLAAGVGTALLVCVVDDWLRAPGRRMVAVLGVVAVVLFAGWEWAPGQNVVSAASSNPSTTASFYRPLLAQLARLAPGPVRVEVPPTEQHWESVFVAAHVSLARGWERQLDIAHNSLFYDHGALTPASYEAWLVGNGVSFVALPRAPLDYAATGEAQLLDSGRVAGLELLWRSPTWTLWRVTASPGLLSGPGRLERVAGDDVVLDAVRPATLTLRVRDTRYWSVSGARARARARACVSRAPGGWTLVHARAAGRIELTTSLFAGSSC